MMPVQCVGWVNIITREEEICSKIGRKKLWKQAVALGSSQAHFQLGIHFVKDEIQRKPRRPRLWLDMNCQDADLEQWRQNLEM